MQAATVAPRALGGTRWGLIALLLALAAVAWVASDLRMAGMDAGPGADLGSLAFYTSVWVVMMAAMMFPSAAPMVVAHARVQAGRRRRGRTVGRGATGVFVTGYLAAWAGFGLAAYALIDVVRSAELTVLAWEEGGRYLAAGTIAAAAAYELTPAKDVCLRKCRTPLDFVLGHWRDGYAGSFRMGAEHGAWCVGCCWALMAALFALGIMSLGWMAFVAALIALEKLAPRPLAAKRGVAVLLAVLAVGVAIAPESVPGLTLPSEMDGMRMTAGM